MTAKTELEDRCTGLDLGADDYVTKPFELKELLARVAAQTRRIEKYSGSDIIYKDLKLDTSNFCISSSNSVSLSIKEFDLLKFLIYNKEKSLTKDYILSNIWKNDNSKTEESLGLYIDYLKNKLEMIGSSVSVFADENGYKLEG